MRFDQELIKYLNGEKFSKSLTVKLERDRYEGLRREAIITSLVKNRSVIHIGCADHIPLILEKIEQNRWLHKLISDNAGRCIGIDINRESIEFVKKETGYENVMHGDVLTDDFTAITKETWDYVVFGEIVEHLDDPVCFLKTFRNRFGASVSRFIITVPNILTRNNFRNMLEYREVINSDHKYWFTPYTISKILFTAGYTPEQIIFSNLTSLNIKQLVFRKIKQGLGIKAKYPFYSFNTIIITGTT